MHPQLRDTEAILAVVTQLCSTLLVLVKSEASVSLWATRTLTVHSNWLNIFKEKLVQVVLLNKVVDLKKVNRSWTSLSLNVLVIIVFECLMARLICSRLDRCQKSYYMKDGSFATIYKEVDADHLYGVREPNWKACTKAGLCYLVTLIPRLPN